jgi:methyl-accepting chemotaxis protein
MTHCRPTGYRIATTGKETMHIEKFSLKTVAISILLALGLLSVILSHFTGQQFREAALDAQTRTLTRVIEVTTDSLLAGLHMEATALGFEIQDHRLDGMIHELMQAPADAQQLQRVRLEFEDVFAVQADATVPLGLLNLRLYDLDFRLVLESAAPAERLPATLADFLRAQAAGRIGQDRLQPLGGLWNSPHGPRYSALVAVGSPQPHAYLEVVVDPVAALRETENAVRAPLQISSASAAVLFRSEHWHEGSDTTLPIHFIIPTTTAVPALELTVLEDVTGLLAVTERMQWSSTLAFAGIFIIGLMMAVFMLNRFIFAPMDRLSRDMERIGRGDYTGAVDTHALKELHLLASGFNSLSHTVQVTVERERQAAEDIRGKVELILDVVEMAASGDLTGQVMVYRDQDVISEMASGIRKMIESLNALVSRIQQSGIQVTSSATEIAATSKQQEATATEQAATTNEIKTTVTEISATSKELVQTMNEVTDVAWKTSEGANQGRRALQRMEQTMRHMMEATAAISTKLAVLSEKAGNINTVVTTITKVADQTNLLSLNAAIEAEKAGEYGVGFAVVATEIRRLADQTAVATWDIEQMVKEMQSAVSAGVMGMEKFSEEVRRGVGDVDEVGGQLTHIIEQVETLIPRFEEVHEGMQAQAQAGQQIRDAMVQLSESASQTAESLRQSNGAIQQLNDAARSLQGAATNFKVSD